MKKMQKIGTVVVSFLLCIAVIGGCGQSKAQNSNLDTSKQVTLNIVGPYTDFQALETVGDAFTKQYPNCKVTYENLQDYSDSLVKRLECEESGIDLFITDNLQIDSPFYPYALDLSSQTDTLDLSDVYEGMTKNFRILGSDEIYSLPMHAEIRGLYVNTTLLEECQLEVPTNNQEFLAACQTLSDHGYVPLQGNPGLFGQQLLYPWIANSIANAENYDTLYQQINNSEEGTSELFREQMAFLYKLVENKYYNYKYVETELGNYTDASDDNSAKSFLGIKDNGNGYEIVEPKGNVPFMAGPASWNNMIEKMKGDYHSDINYEFILTPVASDGGYAYLSPGKGIAINKNAENVDWAVAFLDYFFQEDVNKQFAEDYHVIPNTKDALAYAAKMMDIDSDQVSQLGDVTFDYGFYNIITTSLVNISKANNPKYMDTDADGNAVMYPLEYYMQQLEDAFTAQRNGSEDTE